MRPLLPRAERLTKYLLRIDESRWYSNHGQLASDLERRLAQWLAVPDGSVAIASNGTAALMAAILAAAGRGTAGRQFALLPACTFVATAVAAELCGYTPYLLDVAADTLMMEPDRIAALPAIAQAGIVLPVAAFGRPVPIGPWLEFQSRTGIPVAIDGAASVDRLAECPTDFVGTIPVALSFHATKAFATGEGGGVVSTDAAIVRQAAAALDFGFPPGERGSVRAGFNGKMSEYHAAVGLAELDFLPEKFDRLRSVVAGYRARAAAWGLADRIVASPEIGLSYVLFRARDAAEAAVIEAALEADGIDTRLWYGLGLRHQPYFADADGETLRVTPGEIARMVGLPYAADLEAATIERIVARIAGVLAVA